MSKVVIISGSPNPGSRLTGITQYVESQLSSQHISFNHITVASLPAEALIHAKFDNPEIVEAAAKVEAADIVIIASPVYKASFTGVLKTFLDLLPQKGLNGKFVTPLFIGGTIAHLLAIDFSLKPILSSLNAKHFGSGVYAIDSQIARIDAGVGESQFQINDELKERLDAAIAELVEELQRRG
ncbi:NADPH-dependent FMN reductase [Paenibacillus sp. NEAU-GSW1]|uniref:NADPH-dependent FMN reductase n=1 Tax=Paenibacillus sp. NEAU-GSW1 TaxID=2682486 RepID=UPI0012E170CD|nr:NADPH-dependent FMN reductase [Paenibacillus sp. NEAU-GSW1]MUT64967.1 NADPH-dependent FMN reductase [Paenibacillus sp. NEAU-GSW1]